MFITAVCVIFLIKLRWPKSKSLYEVDISLASLFLLAHILNSYDPFFITLQFMERYQKHYKSTYI